MKVYVKSALVALASGWLLIGCEGMLPEKEDAKSAEVVDKSGQQGSTDATATDTGGTTKALPPSQGWQGHPLDDPDSVLSQTVVYFDFDSSNIRAEDRPVLEAHAQFLADDPSASVVLEGHADERGSREYNIGLGERRANGVRRLLTLLGSSDGQVRSVSYGEERPAGLGHDESSWAQNRRVELRYSG